MSRSKYNVDNSDYGKSSRTVDGQLFASGAEAARYRFLKLLESSGIIDDLSTQPRFEIVSGFTDGRGKKHRARHYTADFRYVIDHAIVIEEVKGAATDGFSIRRDLFLRRYPYFHYEIVKPPQVSSYIPDVQRD
jgi:hypothetical protein